GLEEVVTLLAPDFAEDLLPLGRRVDFSPHAGEAEGAVAYLLGRVRFGVDDAIGVPGLIEDLGAVEGDRPAGGAFDESFFLAFLKVKGMNGRFFAGEWPGKTLHGLS